MSDLVSPGTVFRRRYRIERVIGRGGMSVVVAARRLHLDDVVAVKFLLQDHCKKPDLVARFLREARAATKIRSERIARVFDVDTLDDGTPFIVMELLEGQDLGARLAAQGALPADEAIGLVLQACEALAEAHAMGIVHRDLKPANLFVVTGPDGAPCVKVLDFGISKVKAGASDTPLTSAEALIGSPAYMPPEQISNAAEVDARADVWSLGVILHELVTGRRPFEAAGLPALLFQIVSHAAPDLQELDPTLPAMLGPIVARCLRKSADERFPDVAALAAALCELGPPEASRTLSRIDHAVKIGRRNAVADAPLDPIWCAPPPPVDAGNTPTIPFCGQAEPPPSVRVHDTGSRSGAGTGSSSGSRSGAGSAQERWSETLTATLKSQHLTIKLTVKQIDAALASRDAATVAALLRRLRGALEAHEQIEDKRLYPELRQLAERSGDADMVALVDEFWTGMSEIGQVMRGFFERHTHAVEIGEVQSEWPDVCKALFERLSAEEQSLYPLHRDLAKTVT